MTRPSESANLCSASSGMIADRPASLRDDTNACPTEQQQAFIRTLSRCLIAAITLLLFIRLYLITTLNINWDEFFYLSRVFQFEQQTLTSPFQNFHVHFFGWLTSLSGTEADQIVAARLSMAILGIATVVLVFDLSRRCYGVLPALATTFVYVAFTQSIAHGFSYRADPICAFLCVLAIYLLCRWHRSLIVPVLAGSICAVSVLVSVKSVLYVIPLFAALLWQHGEPIAAHRRVVMMRVISFAVAAIVGTSLLMFWHESKMATATVTEGNAKVGGFLTNTANKMFFDANVFPRLREFRRTVRENLPTWAFFVWSAVIVIQTHRRNGRGRFFLSDFRTELLALAMATPFLAIPFYRNAFPYFYAFLMPASCLVLAAGFSELLSRAQRSSALRILVMLVFTGIAATGLVEIRRHRHSEQLAQRAYLEAIHQMFAAPVPYVDRCSMVSSFPKQGFFMSTWGLEKYRRQDQPIMRELIVQSRPQFLLANSPVLTINDPKFYGENKHPYFLLDDDYQTLHNHFVQHWGAIFVPGQRFDHDAISRGAFEFEILTEGTYTLESLVEVQIDDVLVRPDETIRLAAGRHRIGIASDPASSDLSQPITLRWGDHLFRPTAAPPTQPIFTDL